MKKIYVLCFTILLGIFQYAQSQTYQLPNGGFENWEGSGSSVEPVGWSSFMTASGSLSSFGKQQVCSSSDVHTGSPGSKSVKIYSNSILGVIANGMITTGQMNMGSSTPSDPSNHAITHRSQSAFNQPFHGYPDSIRFWSKFVCQSSSQYARVHAIIHDDYDYVDPESYDGNAPSHVVGKALCEFTRGTQGWTKQTYAFNYSYPANTAKYILITATTN